MWANDLIEELMDLDTEPKPESLWWASIYKDDDERTLKVGTTEICRFFEVFDLLGYRFRRERKEYQGRSRRSEKVCGATSSAPGVYLSRQNATEWMVMSSAPL